MEVLDAQRVLDSEAYQSDAEVILVDDGSTDNSAEIIRKFQEKYTNIRYVYQDNAGQATARNAGIDLATGQYIYMMDQDDVVIPNTLFPMVQCAVEHDAEILEFIAQPTTPEEAADWRIRTQTAPEMNDVVDGPTFLEQYEGLYGRQERMSLCIWNKLYSRQLLHKAHIRFEPIKTHGEDTLFNWYAMLQASKLLVTANLGYLWICHPSSDCHTHEVNRSAAKQVNSFYVANIFRKISKNLKVTRPKLSKIARDIAVSFDFAPWAFIIRRKAIDYPCACQFLHDCKAKGYYPLVHLLPSLVYAQWQAKLLCFAMSWEPILKLLLKLRLPSKSASGRTMEVL